MADLEFKAGPHLFKATPCTPMRFIGGFFLHLLCANWQMVPIHLNISGTLVDNQLLSVYFLLPFPHFRDTFK